MAVTTSLIKWIYVVPNLIIPTELYFSSVVELSWSLIVKLGFHKIFRILDLLDCLDDCNDRGRPPRLNVNERKGNLAFMFAPPVGHIRTFRVVDKAKKGKVSTSARGVVLLIKPVFLPSLWYRKLPIYARLLYNLTCQSISELDGILKAGICCYK